MMSPSSWYKTFMSSYGVDVGSYKPTKGPVRSLRLGFWPIASRTGSGSTAPTVITASTRRPCRSPRLSSVGALMPQAMSCGVAPGAAAAQGAFTYHPSVGGPAGMVYSPFPVERRALVCRSES
jgi:hypothetical protein